MAASKSWPWLILMFVIFTLFTVVICQQSISNKRLCADKECKVTISIAKALARFPGGSSPLFLSFNPGDKIEIKSKSAGNDPSLWGGEVKGQRGYFPKTFAKEMRVIVPSPSQEVDTEGNSFFNDLGKPSIPRREQQLTRDDASQKHEDYDKDDTEVEGDVDETEIDEDLADDEVEIYEGDPDWNEEEADEEGEPLEDYSIDDLDPYEYEEEKNRFDTEEFNAYIQQQQMAQEKDSANEIPSPKEEEKAAEQPSASIPPSDDTEFEHEKETMNVAGESTNEEKIQIADDLNQKAMDHGHSSGAEYEDTERLRGDVWPGIHNEVSNDNSKNLVSATLDEKRDITDSDRTGENEEEDILPPLPEIDEVEKELETSLDKHDESVVKEEEKVEEKTDEEREEEETQELKQLIEEAMGEEEETQELKQVVEEEMEAKQGNAEDAVSKKIEEVKPRVEAEGSRNEDPVTFPVDDDDEEEDDEIPVMDASNIPLKDSQDEDKVEEKLPSGENQDSTALSDEIKMDNDAEISKDGADVEALNNNNVDKIVNAGDESTVDSETKTDEGNIDKQENDGGKEEGAGNEQFISTEGTSNTSDNDMDENLKNELPPEEEKTQMYDNKKPEDDLSDVDEISVEVDKENNVLKETAEQMTGEEKVEVKSEDKASDAVDQGKENLDESKESTNEAPKQDIKDTTDDVSTEDLKDEPGMNEKSPNTLDALNEKKEEESTLQTNEKSEDSIASTVSETKDMEDTTTSIGDSKVADDEKDTAIKSDNLPVSDSKVAVDEGSTAIKADDLSTDSNTSANNLELNDIDTPVTQDQNSDETVSSSQVEEKEVHQNIIPVESSMQETVAKPDISETPSLASQVEKTSNGEGNEKSDDGFETIVEGGTTIILDPNGNLITPALSDEKSEAEKVDATTNIADIAPSKSSSQESESPSTQADQVPVSSNNKSMEANDKTSVDSQPEVDIKANMYQSVDFSSRRVLSVNHQTQVPTSTSQEIPDASDVVASKKESDQVEHIRDTNMGENAAKMAGEKSGSGFLTPQEALTRGREFNEDLLAGMEMSTPDTKHPDTASNANSEPQESTTVPSHQPEADIPQPPTEQRSEPDGADAVPESYETDTVVGRKIDDAHLQEEENLEDAAKARLYYKTMFDSHIRNILIRLPPSIQNLLEQEPLGLSPTMAVVAGVVSMATFFFTCLFSCLCSTGGKKANLKKSLDVIQALEEKLQLAIKEKENIEDSIEDNKEEVVKRKEEAAKAKRESAKMTQELQTVKLHNDTLKNQIKSLEEEVADVRENAQSSQGEVKQSNKKTKEMQKQIKSLEEKEQKATQEMQYLSSELKTKEDEVAEMTSRLEGMGQHISHLETSKEQLLSEAEDWKEKVNDLNERWDQREEEFKQMQESLSFKESELEVLKDCFLQLKSFESEEENSSKVGDKLHSMMDVSKINATLRSVEEERDSLSNKLQIESEARKESEEQISKSQERVESCMSDKMKAERQCQEAQTKLSVLSSYFKEKEMQLQRELGEQEALKKQNQNKLVSADEATKTVQQESEAVRTQNESLKRELANSERDFRSQIAANEKKAHENWLAARAAERELKEARHEAGVLRQKLTDLERRPMMGPGGLIRPMPTRGMPPPGMMNGPPPPPPPGMDRSSSRGSLPHPPHPRDDDYPISPRGGPPPPMDRRGPPPPGMRPPPPDGRSPPPRLPLHDARSPPPRMPPPGMMDGRGSPPFDRRPPPPHLMDRDRDRMTPPFRLPPPDMLPPPPHMRDGPPPPHHGRGGSMSPDSSHGDPRQDPRYRDHPYRNAPPPDRGLRPSPRQPPPPLSPRQPPPDSPRQQQSQV